MQDMNTFLPAVSGFTYLEVALSVTEDYIVGEGHWVDGSIHGFRYHNDGTFDDLGPHVQLPTLDAASLGANARGDVVGSYRTSNGAMRAFIVTAEGVRHDLNEYVDPASRWTLETASGINSQLSGHRTRARQYRRPSPIYDAAPHPRPTGPGGPVRWRGVREKDACHPTATWRSKRRGRARPPMSKARRVRTFRSTSSARRRVTTSRSPATSTNSGRLVGGRPTAAASPYNMGFASTAFFADDRLPRASPDAGWLADSSIRFRNQLQRIHVGDRRPCQPTTGNMGWSSSRTRPLVELPINRAAVPACRLHRLHKPRRPSNGRRRHGRE